jgi:D-alanyl-D-alanine carboxypeptidase
MVFGVGVASGPRLKLVGAVFCATAILLTTVTDAEARRKRKRAVYSPPYASIVIDAKSGRVLQATNPDAHRFPASITKVMTLYLLFEQLERGKLSLNSPITFSRFASSQAPSKLGVPPGRSITAETAILALVTKSANDVAVAVAENIAGTEPAFAALMTAKARSLGMSRTRFANASGLPNPRQVTTARDLTRLGRAIQSHFPRYYRYFQTRSFSFGRRNLRNHNRLLGRVRGVDGIKTGYTRASGFNLLTSARLGNRHIIAVVLGGRSGRSRDNIMAHLVAKNIDRGSTRTTIAAIPKTRYSRKNFAMATPPARPEPAKLREEEKKPAEVAQKPVPRPTVIEKPKEDNRVAGKPMRLAAYAPVRRPAVVSGTANTSDLIPTASIPGHPRTRTVIDGSTRSRAVYGSTQSRTRAPRTATPSELRWVKGPEPVNAKPVPPARIKNARPKLAMRALPSAKSTEIAEKQPAVSRRIPAKAPKIAHKGIVIQVGATDDIEKAHALLSRAKSRSRGMLSRAKAFTEPVRKNGSTLYRARFAGLTERSANSACRTLKRSGMGCFTTRY